MRKSIDTYIKSIVKDNVDYIIVGGYDSIADYIISNAEHNDMWYEYFDNAELDEETGELSEKQIEEFKEYLHRYYDYLPNVTKQAIFELNGDTFRVEPTGDEECKCCYAENGVCVLHESAESDFYGPADEVAERMKEYLKEESSKPVPWWDLVGAVISSNADASKIEDEDDAEKWGEEMEHITVVDNPDEIIEAKVKLDFDEGDVVNRVYKFLDRNGVVGYFVLDKDYEL